MKIIAVIAAFLSIVSGAGMCVNINTGNEIKVKPDVVCETEAVTESTVASESVSETEITQAVLNATCSEDIQETSAPAVTEVQITETEGTEMQQGTEEAVTELPEAVSYEKVSEVTVSETEESEAPEYFEYQVLYKELLDEITANTETKYMIYDMNDDDVPELITITGTCEADKTTTFYTIKDHKVFVAGEGFRGDHSEFCTDARRGRLVIRNDWCGAGCVTGYVIDGGIVYKSEGIEDYDYMIDPEGYEEAISEVYDLRNEAYGLVYSDGTSVLVTLNYDTVELCEGSYYFTD